MMEKSWGRTGDAGLNFTALGFGTAPLANLYTAVDDDVARQVLEGAWDGGVRYYDTAPLYGLGLGETRLNPFLRGKDRDSYILSTKIGRWLKVASPDKRDGIGKWFDVPARNEVYDYGYDGTLRSIEFSLERLGVDRIDILYAHDLDIFNHGSKDALDEKLTEFLNGGYKALLRLRDEGTIKAFGAGVNEWQPCQYLAERGDFDVFLLAGRYTLLEQESLETFLPLCESRGIGVVIGGPYNSGILATGPKPGAFFNYDPAPEPILKRVGQIQEICSAHSVRLVDAAFQFVLRHPAVVSVIPGGQAPAEMESNLAAATVEIPEDLWSDLKSAGLMREDAP
ncbi:aldo/keto reductase [Marivita sp.]|uniref:aldo/keto reductase n=1 Tax=Marivita sp. TaxID=2003365 RepID=UPI00262D9AF3|nr:aldo/keto reductase [Marivita sp.]